MITPDADAKKKGQNEQPGQHIPQQTGPEFFQR